MCAPAHRFRGGREGAAYFISEFSLEQLRALPAKPANSARRERERERTREPLILRFASVKVNRVSRCYLLITLICSYWRARSIPPPELRRYPLEAFDLPPPNAPPPRACIKCYVRVCKAAIHLYIYVRARERRGGFVVYTLPRRD